MLLYSVSYRIPIRRNSFRVEGRMQSAKFAKELQAFSEVTSTKAAGILYDELTSAWLKADCWTEDMFVNRAKQHIIALTQLFRFSLSTIYVLHQDAEKEWKSINLPLQTFKDGSCEYLPRLCRLTLWPLDEQHKLSSKLQEYQKEGCIFTRRGYPGFVIGDFLLQSLSSYFDDIEYALLYLYDPDDSSEKIQKYDVMHFVQAFMFTRGTASIHYRLPQKIFLKNGNYLEWTDGDGEYTCDDYRYVDVQKYGKDLEWCNQTLSTPDEFLS